MATQNIHWQIPYKWKSELKNMQDWVIKELMPLIPKVTAFYKLTCYSFHEDKREGISKPCIHTFHFSLINPKEVPGPNLIQGIKDQLSGNPFIENPFEEEQQYQFSPEKQHLVIILRASY